jgi:TRAP-type C4-dicarboxylate transport system substrate-binding protein
LATFGFHDILETVTCVRSVPDAQMFAANSAWFNSLAKDLQMAFEDASRKTELETFAQIAPARTESMRIMTASGTKFYNPSAAEFKQWVDTCGEARKEWDEDKIELAGSVANFDKLRTAANTKGPITVGDYQG